VRNAAACECHSNVAPSGVPESVARRSDGSAMRREVRPARNLAGRPRVGWPSGQRL